MSDYTYCELCGHHLNFACECVNEFCDHYIFNYIKMNKTIVFDLDDTISFCHDRDWANARPNIDLIRKINKLYNDGWTIHIHSARGQLSGIDYTEIVSKWLEENGVLYHKLQFGKPLAMLYVDDKAIHTEDFMNLDIKELPGGWSGKRVLKVGSKIFKVDEHIESTIKWYQHADPHYNVPKILSVIGNELVLQYVEPNEDHPKATYEECQFLARTFEAIQPINNFKWKHYIDRIASHCDKLQSNRGDKFHHILKELANMQPPKRTFCHGDLTPDNTIRNRKGYIVLVDPLNVTYSSFELDIAKVESWQLRYNSDDVVLNTLVVAETIRTLTYAPDDIYHKLKAKCLNYLHS